jgi:phage replication-related protein YjqB (UPF0714/DUF867 family)
MKLKMNLLSFLLALTFSLALPQASFAAGCTAAPSIRFKSGGIEKDRITVEFNENCTGEVWSKVWAQNPDHGAWSRIRTDFGDLNGWRPATDEPLEPNKTYCYEAENYKDGIIKISERICATTPLPKVELGLISSSASVCGTLPSDLSDTDEKEHVFITEALAVELGIDPAHVQASDPSPQVRVVIDSPVHSAGYRRTANFTVARVCTGAGPFDWNLWMWNDDKIAPGSDTFTLSTAVVTVHPVAPSRTSWTENGIAETPVNHFVEPNTGNRFFRENVRNVTDKRVALLIPHGGAIEINTSAQLQPFVDELAAIGVNVWESQGQFTEGGSHDRWHITAPDIHPDGFPGLARLLDEPEFSPGRSFQYAVAFHGFTDKTDLGVVLGGLADRDVLCYVADAIQDEAGDRADEIGFHIANAGLNGQDIRIENVRDYAPNRTDLEGRSEDNIVNWISHADGSAAWGGIQLEQSSCLRRESDCDIDGNGTNETCTSPNCMHEIVARGVARALAELLDASNPADPAGSCCANFNQCP